MRGVKRWLTWLAALLGLCLPFIQPRAQESADLLVTGGTVVTMDARRRILSDGTVAIRGDTIVGVGERAEIEGRFVAARRIDARGKLVLPGLINGHTHAPMTLFRGLADDASLHDWLENYIFPAEKRYVNAEFVTWGTRLAALEQIRAGVTTFADMYYFEDDIARAAKEAGMRAVLGETVIGFPAPDNKTPAEALAYTERFLQRWKDDPRIRPAVAPHSVYLCDEDTLRRSAALARRFHAPILIHLAESQGELEESRAKHGLSSVAYLDRIGVLGSDVVAAHCIWLDAADLALLARRQAGCVHNPSSNMLLASGVAPVPQMLEAGVRVGLGTDGSAGGNHDLDLREEMGMAVALQKVTRNDPQALRAEQAVAMATIEGARALHLEQEIGSLEPGKKADLVLIDLDNADGVPSYHPYSQIVYALRRPDVDTVIIGGRTVMDHGRVLTIDEPAVLAKARDYARQVQRSAGGVGK
jgi:5-methylthioadenosine/S-adenosylhomocysteine deaminase